MFAVSDPQILKYVDDYRLHLIVANEITDFDGFRTSLREVLERNPRFKSLENEAVSAINVCTGLKVPVNKKEKKTDILLILSCCQY